ncbi:MAG: formylmethanofuran dehydrogenase subunit E family protein [Desulfobacteraceae bacterium]|nr:formylmethanofuran dehydrogenase subunit E family protein [Desulfobacteraceae bacterium]
MDIGPYSFEEFLERASAFHGNPAPGLVIGGYMVELARSRLPQRTIFDAVVETPKCLPDAVQLLTPCSIGNGWMKVINWGLYALTLYDKYTGKGVRVWLDPERLEKWPEIRAWYLKLKPAREQDKDRLLNEMRRAGGSVCGVSPVRVKIEEFKKKSRGAIEICSVCKEGYPSNDGSVCRKCQQASPYMEIES